MTPDRGRPPLYARVLRLRYLRLGGTLCFLFFEGAVVLAVLLSLAELTPWWSVVLLPLTVAAMVKVNDVVAGALGRSGGGEGRVPPPEGGSGPVRSTMPRPAVPQTPGSAGARGAVPGLTRAEPAPAEPRRRRELPRP